MNTEDTSSWLPWISLGLLLFISHHYNVILLREAIYKKNKVKCVWKGNCLPAMKSIQGKGRRGKGRGNTTQTQSPLEQRKFWRNITFPAWTTNWGSQTKAWLLANIGLSVCVEEAGKGKPKRAPAIQAMRPSILITTFGFMGESEQLRNVIVINDSHSPHLKLKG